MVGYHLLTEAQSIQLGVWREGGTVSPPPPTPPAGPGQCPGACWNFLKIFLNIGLRKMFEKLTIHTF